jgi:hypothetical protein
MFLDRGPNVTHLAIHIYLCELPAIELFATLRRLSMAVCWPITKESAWSPPSMTDDLVAILWSLTFFGIDGAPSHGQQL